MIDASRMARQLEETVDSLRGSGIRFALIGGLALAAHKVIRATQDIDLLVDGSRADLVDRALAALGYRCIHRSADAGNYLRGDERVDVLYATRPIALQLLAAARDRPTALGQVPVIGVEGLIGFKLQGVVNDPRRTQDLEDIRALLRANRAAIDLSEVREYFRLFARESLLEELLDESE
jgi:hypothetical protein